MLWKMRKEKRKGFSLLFGFGPAFQPDLILLRSPAQWQRCVYPFPASPLWAEPSERRWPSKLARTLASASPCVSVTPWPRMSGAPSSFPRRRWISLSKFADAESTSLSPPSLLGSPLGYISEGAVHSRLHPILLQHQPSSRDATVS
jgi:hypothetical protein